MPKETSRRYATPHRPLPLRLANASIGRAWRRGRLEVALEVDDLIARARRSTGLHDLGDDSFREPLGELLASIEAEARLNPVGRLITRTRMVSSLATRLRIEDWHRRHPEIGELTIRRPVVIVGLPRTGTTLLQRLLAADPRNRALRSWEALEPAPVGKPGGPERKRRIRRAQVAERALKWMAPDFFAIHPVEALAPEEEVLLLDLAFRSTVPEATLRVPSFARWLESQDQTPAYRYLVRALQLLTWQEAPREDEGGHWVLKTPHHLEWLDVLLQTFPDALVVWTQRDPKTVAASFCSMLAHGRGVFSDDVDPVEIGREWTRKSARMLGRGQEVRARLGDASFMDVAYEELVRDPLAIASAIAERRGSALSPEAQRAMRSFLAVQKQHRHGVHRYDAADFGLET